MWEQFFSTLPTVITGGNYSSYGNPNYGAIYSHTNPYMTGQGLPVLPLPAGWNNTGFGTIGIGGQNPPITGPIGSGGSGDSGGGTIPIPPIGGLPPVNIPILSLPDPIKGPITDAYNGITGFIQKEFTLVFLGVLVVVGIALLLAPKTSSGGVDVTKTVKRIGALTE